jgi:hypothetical protein
LPCLVAYDMLATQMPSAEPIAPSPVLPARERFSVGGALSRSIGIWARNLPFFFGMSFLAYVPMLLLWPRNAATPVGCGLFFLGIVISTVLGYIVTGLVTYTVLEQLRGRSPQPAKSLAVGWAKAEALFFAALVTGALIGLAALAFVIPGIILSIRWILVAPVVVAEEGVNPRQRSSVLTEGHRGGIFGFLVLILLGSAAMTAFAVAVVGSATNIATQILTQTIPSGLALSFDAVAYGVIYYQLRSEKEGIDLEQLTAVFQ